MSDLKELGKKGETLAGEYLLNKGYQILARNWHCDHLEIDIIARDEDEIVIVEVKTRIGNYFEEPWESVTTGKIRNLVKAADAWLINEEIDLETRFDVISVIFSKDGKYKLTHFMDAFTPPVN